MFFMMIAARGVHGITPLTMEEYYYYSSSPPPLSPTKLIFPPPLAGIQLLVGFFTHATSHTMIRKTVKLSTEVL